MGGWLRKRKCWRQRKADMEVGGARAPRPDGSWHYQQQLQQGRLTSEGQGSGYPTKGGLSSQMRAEAETRSDKVERPLCSYLASSAFGGQETFLSRRLTWQRLATAALLVFHTLSQRKSPAQHWDLPIGQRTKQNRMWPRWARGKHDSGFWKGTVGPRNAVRKTDLEVELNLGLCCTS